MEHTIAYLVDDIRKESRRADYLEEMIRNHANHLWSDVSAGLKNYPRAINKEMPKNDD